jgi:hypothetical protein
VKKTTNQFCLDLLALGVRHNKALVNVVMALSSQKVSSPVTLSESPIYRYQYSSLSDAVEHLSYDDIGLERLEEIIQPRYLRDYWSCGDLVILQTDKTSVVKGHSPTLADRAHVPIANTLVRGNKPVNIGYEYSFVNLHAGEGKWSLPLSSQRIGIEDKSGLVAAKQIRRLLHSNRNVLQSTHLIVNGLDSGYANPSYLDNVKELSQLVSTVRLRAGTKVWDRAAQEDQKTGKCPKIYGQCYYLIEQSGCKTYRNKPKSGEAYQRYQTAIKDKTPDEHLTWSDIIGKDRQVTISLQRYCNLLFRTRDGCSMLDKPFDLICVEVRDAKTNKLVFKQPMFLGLFGQKKEQLSTRQAYDAYQKRYDIEPFFRFAKQNMALDGFQTPDQQHLNNWMYIIIMAVWLLFTARNDLTNKPKKWQQYLPSEKPSPNQALSLAQAQKAALMYLLTFDPQPFLPVKSKPGPGRQKGMRQPQRTKYPYRIKNTKFNPKKTKTAQKPP